MSQPVSPPRSTTDVAAAYNAKNELASLFDFAPVSLWLEDYSALFNKFAQFRASGVNDLLAHFKAQPEAIGECSACIKVLEVNQRTLDLFGADDLAHLAANLSRVFRDDMHAEHAYELNEIWLGRNGFSNQTVNYSLDDRRIDVLIDARVMPGHEHDWSRVMVAVEDITERVRSEARRVRSEAHARGLFEHSPVSLWLEDFSGVRDLLEGARSQGISDFRTFLNVHSEFIGRCAQAVRVLDVNQVTLKLFGANSKQELLGKLDVVFRDDTRVHFAEQLLDLWNGKLFQQREVVNYALDGSAVNVYLQLSVLPGYEGDWSQVLVSLTDITARKKAEAYLEYLGKNDALTKLHNRAFFDEEMARMERNGPFPIAVIYLDLNGLKPVNDELGHAAGDGLLRRAGEVLQKAAGEQGCIARVGGDEFAVLLPASDERAAQHFLNQLEEILALNNQFYQGARLSFATGYAVCEKGERLDAAMRVADKNRSEERRVGKECSS